MRAKELRTEVVNGGLGSERADGERERERWYYVYDPRNAAEGPRRSFGFRSGANVTKRYTPGSVWLFGNTFFFLFGKIANNTLKFGYLDFTLKVIFHLYQ